MSKSSDNIHIPLSIMNYAHDYADSVNDKYEHDRRIGFAECKQGNESEYQLVMNYRQGLHKGFLDGYRKALNDIKKQKEYGSRL